MSDAVKRDQRIARYLDGLASQEEADRLGGELAASPAAALAFARQAWIETCLERQFAGTAAEPGGEGALRRRPSGRRQLALRAESSWSRGWMGYALAASLALCLSAVLAQAWSGSAATPAVEMARVSQLDLAPGGAPARIETAAGGSLAGRGSSVRAGDRLVTAAQGVQLALVGEATVLRCEPGSVVAFRRHPDGTRVILDTGVLHASVATQQPGRQLRVVTPFGEALVVGTRFTVEVRSDATRVRVSEGAVRLLRPSTLEEVAIAAGYEAVSAAHGALGPASLISPERRESPVVWPLASGITKYFLSSTAAWRELRDPDGMTYGRFTARTPPSLGAGADQEEFAWITLDREAQDWSSGGGLLLHVRGTGDGRRWVCEIYDDLPVERFVQGFADDAAGWREVFLPFSGFVRRADSMQHAQAPADGLGLVRMHGAGMIAPAGEASLDIARITVVPLR